MRRKDMMKSFIIPEYQEKFQDVPFSYDRSYKSRIDGQKTREKPSAKMLEAEPTLIRVPEAPEATKHYATDGTPLQTRPEGPVAEAGQVPEDGRYYTEIGSAHIEAFFKKGTRDYLYVFPDGARTRNQGKDLAPLPSFLRWSWYQFTSASVLCLEDPMYYTYSDLKLGWFYGTEEEDYAEYCAMLIRHIAGLLNIPFSHIILYGPSGGGHAVINMSAFIPGCMTVTVNGQYDITLHDYWLDGFFPCITGLPADSLKGLKRNRSADIIREHPENRYLLICNILSEQDFDRQLQKLCGKLDFAPRYGLKTEGHITVWLIEAQGTPEPHNTWENQTQFQMIDILLVNLISGHSTQEMNEYCEIINQYWRERYDLLAKIRKMENAPESAPKSAAVPPASFFRRAVRKLKAVLRR